MTDKSITVRLIELMKEFDQYKHLSGRAKKALVLRTLSEEITLDNAIERLLIDMIDALIAVDKDQIKITSPKTFLKRFWCFK